MNITEAERIIRGGAARYQELEETKAVLRAQLHRTPSREHAHRARIYYELVRSTLAQEHASENGILSNEFASLQRELQLEETAFENKLQQSPDRDARLRIVRDYLAFCHQSDRSMTSLEALFRRHGFYEKEQAAFLSRMRYRTLLYRLEGKWVNRVVYAILDATSRFGTSFQRWGVTTIITILCFGALMMITDSHQTGSSMIALGSWYDYFYFSVIAFTTAGFGDILPSTGLLKLVVGIEVLLGYVMLGILINLIQRKMR